MSESEEIVDSPTGWVAKHVRDYVDSDGARGHRWRGLDTLLLTTRGRRSGLLRRTAPIYGRDGDRHVVVASNGGAAEHPFWYHNLVAEPVVQVQVGAEKFAARARTADADERPALWELMVKQFPTYDGYQRRAPRTIPVVILDRI